MLYNERTNEPTNEHTFAKGGEICQINKYRFIINNHSNSINKLIRRAAQISREYHRRKKSPLTVDDGTTCAGEVCFSVTNLWSCSANQCVTFMSQLLFTFSLKGAYEFQHFRILAMFSAYKFCASQQFIGRIKLIVDLILRIFFIFLHKLL